MDLEEHTEKFKFLLRDRGPQFTDAFDADFTDADIDVITTAVRAPVMNAIQERWHRSVRAELLNRTLVWNLAHLRHVLAEYETFYTNTDLTARLARQRHYARCRTTSSTSSTSA